MEIRSPLNGPPATLAARNVAGPGASPWPTAAATRLRCSPPWPSWPAWSPVPVAATPARATTRAAADAQPAPELPGGGRRIIPGRHVVALYGAPQDRELGALGIGSPDSAARRLQRQARAYRSRSTRELPAMELIATVANRDAGRRRADTAPAWTTP